MKPQNIEDIYELTPTQQGILFHSLVSPKSGVYLIQNCLVIEGNLDRAAFADAWQQVIDRHSALRSAFYIEGVEKPLQVVKKQLPISLIERDWREKSPEEQKAALKTYLQEDIEKGFDLTEAPLMRLALMQLSENSYQFVWSKHHLIIDGWSTGIVFKEVFAIYEKLRGKNTINLAPAPAYRNYITWLQQQDLAKVESFWRDNLKGFTAPTSLTVDRKITFEEKTGYGDKEIHLSKKTTSALQSARQHKLTLNTIFQGVWSLLLSRYSGETDVIYGSTCAGRPADLNGSESIVGIFINTIPVRVKVNLETKLLTWLQELQVQLAEIRQYEHSPLVQIQQWSEVPRGLPLFESLVVFENYPIDSSIKQRDTDWSIRDIASVDRTNYPLTVIAIPDSEIAPGKFVIKMSYDRQRFENDAIERMLGHLENLLSNIANNPDRQLADLPLITEPERNKILYEWNSSEANYNIYSCLHQLVEDRVRRSPDNIALIFEEEEITYRELNTRANKLAHYLQKKGVKPEVKVGLCVERSLEMVISILAILKAGGAYVPLDPTYPSDRLNFILEDANISILVTQDKLLDSIAILKKDRQVICLDSESDLISNESTENPNSNVQPENLAYIIYTSGSTGNPKGVLVPHNCVTRLFAATESWYNFKESDIWSLFHSYAFDFSVWELWGALIYGGCLVVIPHSVIRNPQAFYRLLCDRKVTVLNQTPSAFYQLIQAEETDRKLNLRLVIFGGEALNIQNLKPWFDRHGDRIPQLVNMYGITETTVHVTYRPLSLADLNSKGSVIGRPIPDLQVYVLDRALQPVPIGVTGEMYVGGTGVSRGYLNRPELTEERFISNPFVEDVPWYVRTEVSQQLLYKTGDLARYLPNGDLEYLGRIDNQVKIRGFRIELGEIEATLCQHPAIREVVVIAREEGEDRRLIAYFVASSEETPTSSDLREYLRKKLPEYEIPAVFMSLQSLPLTANGKIDRPNLPYPTGDRLLSGETYVMPKTELEQKIAAIWQEVLGIEKVGIKDNFFDLGGNSLLMMRLYSKMKETIALIGDSRIDFPLLELFRYPTISALANYFSSNNNSEAKPILERSATIEAGKTRLKQRLKQKKRVGVETYHGKSVQSNE